MSTQESPSPRQGPTVPVDESQLPAGQCRYILLHPEIKGQRCGCVNFTLNRAIPSTTCDCGHLACYHVKTTEAQTDNHEMEQLKQRLRVLENEKQQEMRQLRQEVQILQEQLGREREVVVRISKLEDEVEKSKDEVSQEFKACYRNVNRAWHSITHLEQRSQQQDQHLRDVDRQLQDVGIEQQRLDQRQHELNDEIIALDERIDGLVDEVADEPETTDVFRPQQATERWRRRSVADSTPPARSSSSHGRRRSLSAGREPQAPLVAHGFTTMPVRAGPSPPPSALWVVHISLLPTASQPFPFERDTNAYKRCLSRGLHQMVAIDGTDAESIERAVSKSFSNLLHGREWMPLQALPCTAEHLAGLPMLRPLDRALVESTYDWKFLRQHCAVCDRSGKIDSLYIAMKRESLSWHFIKHAPVHMQNLESSWAYDRLLDQNSPFDDDDEIDDTTRPSAGDMIPSFPSLKRAASEMSRSSSFGSAATVAEGGSRPKMPRTCPLPNVVENTRRGVETA